MKNLLLVVTVFATVFGFTFLMLGDVENVASVEDEAADVQAVNLAHRPNPSGKIPNRGFKAVYVNRAKPDAIVFEENVDNISIRYAWDKFHGIPSEQFDAYWVGRLKLDQSSTKLISINESNSKSAVRVNGEVIYETGNDKEFTHHFAAGEHIIEVEHANGWHTVAFKVTLQDQREYHGPSSIGHILSSAEFEGAEVHYVGLYQSDAKNITVKVDPPKSDRPVILWFDSLKAIDWHISSKGNVAAAVVGSLSKGSRVIGQKVGRVIHTEHYFGVRSKTKSCNCMGTHFYCNPKRDLIEIGQEVESITGKPFAEFFVKYEASRVRTVPYTPDVVKEISASRSEIEALEGQCRNSSG